MRVRDLIQRLSEFEPEAEIQLQLDSRNFAPQAWLGIMDTAGLFDEEKNLQLVIAAWEPEEHLKTESGPVVEGREEFEQDMTLTRQIMRGNRKAPRELADAPSADDSRHEPACYRFFNRSDVRARVRFLESFTGRVTGVSVWVTPATTWKGTR
jgi:hypothetical protein